MKLLAFVVALMLALLGTAPRNGATLITLDVHDASISDVLALLASESGTNVVADGSIKPQRITLHLRGVTFQVALTALVHAHDLQVRRDGNVLIVGSSEVMNRRYSDANDPRSPRTAVLPLANASPEDVGKEIQQGLP
ncbi:MAG: hypothetical protein M3R35_00185, partial [Candidatus Eremiobacteraeota bacterium]|nr:hypothetical protein [Candidatus Eremiobacteraeota bacterium]